MTSISICALSGIVLSLVSEIQYRRYRRAIKHSLVWYRSGYISKYTSMMSICMWSIGTMLNAIESPTGWFISALYLGNTYMEYRQLKKRDYRDLDNFMDFMKKKMKAFVAKIKRALPSLAPGSLAPSPV